jgi:hypothetical protein
MRRLADLLRGHRHVMQWLAERKVVHTYTGHRVIERDTWTRCDCGHVERTSYAVPSHWIGAR